MDIKELKSLVEAYSEVYAPHQLDEISQKTATSAYAQRRTGEFEGDDASDRVAKTNKLKGRIEKKFGKEAGKHADRAADVQTFGRKDASGRRKQSPQPRIQTSDHENQREFKRELRIRRDRRLRAARGEDTNEQFDIFNVVLEFLQVEGYAETLEEAEWLMANVINEEAIDIILGEEQLDEISKRLATKAYLFRTNQNAHSFPPGGGPSSRTKSGKSKSAQTRKYIKSRYGEKAAKKAGEMASRYSDPESGYDPYKYDKADRKESFEVSIDEAQAARENPEKYEREQAKKSAPVRGERTPMPPRGDKRREDFEKWYAKNVR